MKNLIVYLIPVLLYVSGCRPENASLKMPDTRVWVEKLSVQEIGYTHAMLQGEIIRGKNARLDSIVIEMATDNGFNPLLRQVSVVSTEKNLALSLDSLKANEKYFLRVAIYSGAGLHYSEGISFQTSNEKSIQALDCGNAIHNGKLTENTAASGVSSVIPYSGGNGSSHTGQVAASTGVTGLTASLSAGTFATGNGTLTYTITGTPTGNGTASFAIKLGGQNCTLTRVVDQGLITGLSCNTAVHSGTLIEGLVASGVSSSISYTGGNASPYSAQTIVSTGVTGLTANLSAGSFASGNGSVSYTISGKPVGNGTASFAVSLGGQSCTLTRVVNAPIVSWRPGMVHCGTPSQVVPVTNPSTGRTWMDRNLGASRVATSYADASAYGDLYQWGRFGDGHQCRNSGITSTLSSINTPGHGNFITTSGGNYDWRSPQNNNLWQGVNGINNPCPTGYRLPTDSEWDAERISWTANNNDGAFASPLKLPLPGSRSMIDGWVEDEGRFGYYWSATVSGISAGELSLSSSRAELYPLDRSNGYSVRCLQD